MAAARKIEDTVSSGGVTKSGNNADDGGRSRTEIGPGDQTKPAIETNSAASIKPVSAGSPSSTPSSEQPNAGAEGEVSLGKILSAARERRGISRAEAVAKTRIPAHYIEMIESNDYGLISDQLYLLPFLRRYAAFLNLDGEEIAMRFVREVQRAEGAAVPRMSEPLALQENKSARWGKVTLLIILLSAIIVLYVIASRRNRSEFGLRPSAPSAVPAAPNAARPPDAPARLAAPAPQAAAPVMPPTTVVGDPAGVPAPSRPLDATPKRAPAPAASDDE